MQNSKNVLGLIVLSHFFTPLFLYAQFAPLPEGDRGFRYDPEKKRCFNAQGIEGINNQTVMECGAVAEPKNISNQDFSNKNLRSFRMLSKAEQTQFKNSDLRNSTFVGSIDKSDFTNADFTEASIRSSCVDTDFTNAQFYNAIIYSPNLKSAEFKNAKFFGARFQTASMEGSNFNGGSFPQAGLERFSNISNSSWVSADLRASRIIMPRPVFKADFSSAFLDYSDVRGPVTFEEVLFRKASMKGIIWGGLTCAPCDFSDANLTKANIFSSQFNANTKAQRLRAEKSTWETVIFDRADFSNAQLRASFFYECKLQNIILSGADLKDSYFFGPNTCQNLQLNNSDIRGVDFGSCDLSTASLNGAKFNKFTKASLSKEAMEAKGAIYEN